jgi:hypothetical protein
MGQKSAAAAACAGAARVFFTRRRQGRHDSGGGRAGKRGARSGRPASCSLGAPSAAAAAQGQLLGAGGLELAVQLAQRLFQGVDSRERHVASALGLVRPLAQPQKLFLALLKLLLNLQQS